MEKKNGKLGILRHLFSSTTELVVDSMTGSNQNHPHVPVLPSKGPTQQSVGDDWVDFHSLALAHRMILSCIELWLTSKTQ